MSQKSIAIAAKRGFRNCRAIERTALRCVFRRRLLEQGIPLGISVMR